MFDHFPTPTPYSFRSTVCDKVLFGIDCMCLTAGRPTYSNFLSCVSDRHVYTQSVMMGCVWTFCLFTIVRPGLKRKLHVLSIMVYSIKG